MAMGRIGAVVLVSAAVSGCAGTNGAFWVYGNPVSPTPAPGYRLECQTLVLGPSFLVFDGTTAYCRQVIAPPRAVVSVRG